MVAAYRTALDAYYSGAAARPATDYEAEKTGPTERQLDMFAAPSIPTITGRNG